MRPHTTRISNALERLGGNRDGASAIEFALLLPLMLLLLAGLVDLGQGLTVRRKINQIASTTSEIIAMQTSWSDASVASILSGVSSILDPYDSSGLKVVLCVVDIDKKGVEKVNWSAARGTAALAAGQASPVEIPDELQEKGVQMVVTRVQYKLDTIFSGLFESFTGGGAYEFDQNFFVRPRNGDTITYE